MPDRGHGPTPPTFWEGLLRRMLPAGAVVSSILGDLREEFTERARSDPVSARRWYRRSVIGIVARAVLDRAFLRPSARARNVPGLRSAGPYHALRDVVTGALRTIRRSRRFALAVVATLALGLGANVTIFGLVDALLLSPPDGIRDPHGVRRLLVDQPAFGTHEPSVSAYLTYPDYEEFRKLDTFSEVGAYAGTLTRTLGWGDQAVPIVAGMASPAFFRVLGVTAALGRLFTDEDAAPGAEPTVILAEPFWRRHFGGDPAVLGRRLDIGEGRYTVVGVTPERFTGADLKPVDVFLELEARAAIDFGSDADWRTSRNWWWINAVGRLATGVDAATADAATTTVFRAARRGGAPDRRMVSSSLVAADGPEVPDVMKVVPWLAGVSLLVLLIACANVANLMLVRATRRRQEIAVRCALGLGRRRLVARLLAESLVLAAMGGVAALFVAQWGGAALRTDLFPSVRFPPLWSNWRISVFTVLAVLASTCLAGLVPAVRAGAGNMLAPLRDGARGATADRALARSALVAIQASLTVILLVGAGLFVRSLRSALRVDLGFDADPLVTASLELNGDPAAQERVDLYYRALEDVRRLPDVHLATFHVVGPFQGSIQARVQAEGHDSIPRVPGGGPYVFPVGPDYFETLGIDVLRGRAFLEEDHRPGAERVAVVNAAMERVLWPGGDALGRCLYIREGPCNRVVGVVATVSHAALVEAPAMMYYVPFRERVGQVPNAFVVRGSHPGPGVPAELRAALRGVSSQVRYVRIRSYREILEPTVRSWRLGATVFSAFGVLALLVAAVGLYSTLAFHVAHRRHELGVRSALGASAGRLVGVVVGQTLAAVALGALTGAVLALVGARGLQGLLFGVTAADPAAYEVAGGTLFVLALVAAAAPAWRAARSDPIVALRSD